MDLDVAAGRAAVAHDGVASSSHARIVNRKSFEVSARPGRHRRWSEYRVVELRGPRRREHLVNRRGTRTRAGARRRPRRKTRMQREHRMQRSDRARSSAEIGRLGLVHLRHVDARVRVVVVEVQLLQRALAGLVADRAVDRVVQQRELSCCLRASVDCGSVVCTTIPSAHACWQLGCSFGFFSIETGTAGTARRSGGRGGSETR